MLGTRPVAAVDAALINDAVASLWARAPETASRVKQRIERIVQWVTDGQTLPTTNGKSKQHHAALPWQEVPGFMAELRQRQSVSARALEFCILTAARTSEVIGAAWDEVDLGSKNWSIPAERMKAHRPHRVPLSAPVIDLLQALPTEKNNDYIFIGAKEGQGLSNMSMLQLLRGMRPGLTVHGFRSSFKTWADETQHVENAVVETALAHISGDKVEQAYRRGDMIAKRAKLMAAWAEYCASKPAVVAPLHQERQRRSHG